MNTTTEPLTLELVLEESNQPLVSTGEREQLVATLKPIVANIEKYNAAAAKVVVTNEADAKAAAAIIQQIAADEATVEDAILKHKSAAKKRHSLWCDLEGLFLDPFSIARRKIKQAVMGWQAAEEERARKETARLQAEADERARLEQERLRKQAEKLKTPEKKEQRLEQAAAIVPPVVYVAPPARAVKAQSRWFVKTIDRQAFIEAAAKDKSLIGYIDIDANKLARGKAANSELSIPGVVFEMRLV